MTFRQFLQIVEFRTKIVSLSTFSLAVFWVLSRQDGLDPILAVLVFAAALALDMGTTAFNTFFDFWNGADDPAYNREKDKVLIHDRVAPGPALLTAVALFAIAAALGLVIGAFTGWGFVLAGALCMAVGFCYNGGPLPISRTPLGELFAGGFLGGAFFVMTVYTQTRILDGATILMSLAPTLIIASILTVNNTCDRVGDRAAGRLTLSILIGEAPSRVIIVLLGLFAYLSAAWVLMIFEKANWIVLIPLILGMLLSLPLYAALNRRGFSHATKGPSMKTILRVFLTFTLALLAALATDRMIAG